MRRNVKEVILQHNGYKFNVTLYEHSWIGWYWQRRLDIICLNPPEGVCNVVYNNTCPICDTWWDRMNEAKSQIHNWCHYADMLKNEEKAFKEAQRSGGVF